MVSEATDLPFTPSLPHQLSLVATLQKRWKEAPLPNCQATALVWLGEDQENLSWSYHELEQQIFVQAQWLRQLGLEKGSVLGLQLPKGPQWLPLFLGALSQGIIVLLLNDSYTAHELAYYLSDAQAQVAIIPSSKHLALKGLLKPIKEDHTNLTLVAAEYCQTLPTKHLQEEISSLVSKELTASDLAVLAYTSGTTGRPKGAQIRHQDMMGTITGLHKAWGWSIEDRLVHTLPLFHIHGLFVAALGALWAKAQILMLSSFSALKALQAVERHQATILMAVPTHHHRYLQIPAEDRPNVTSLRLVTSGSAPLSSERFEAFKSAYGKEIVERYGMTEIGIVLSAKLHGEKKPGSVGYPLPGVLVRICDANNQEVSRGEIGELHISSPSLFLGYHQLPEATSKSVYLDQDQTRWMRTGDLGYQDKDGMYWLKGRASEMIISGGLNVYPKEVEQSIIQIAKDLNLPLDEVAVVGLDDVDWGERVEAFVTTLNQQELSKDSLSSITIEVKKRLAGYKCPKNISWLATLPRNAMGKLQRFKLKTI